MLGTTPKCRMPFVLSEKISKSWGSLSFGYPAKPLSVLAYTLLGPRIFKWNSFQKTLCLLGNGGLRNDDDNHWLALGTKECTWDFLGLLARKVRGPNAVNLAVFFFLLLKKYPRLFVSKHICEGSVRQMVPVSLPLKWLGLFPVLIETGKCENFLECWLCHKVIKVNEAKVWKTLRYKTIISSRAPSGTLSKWCYVNCQF